MPPRRYLLAVANAFFFGLIVFAVLAIQDPPNLTIYIGGWIIVLLWSTVVDGVNGRIPRSFRAYITHFLAHNSIIYFDIFFLLIIFPLIILEAASALAWIVWLVMLAIMGTWLLQWLGILAETVARYDPWVWQVFISVTIGQIVYHIINQKLKAREQWLVNYLKEEEETAVQRIYDYFYAK